MGREYSKRAVGTAGGLAVPVNTVTLSTALQTLAVGGVNAVTYDTSGNPSDAIFPAPAPGDVVRVTLNNGTTSLEANFNTDSTGSDFFGTAFNTITIASTAGTLVPSFELTGVSTSQWAITAISSSVDWTLAASTGSTGSA